MYSIFHFTNKQLTDYIVLIKYEIKKNLSVWRGGGWKEIE